MTIYYVNFTDGLDANNGLGPDASHASNKPWKTIAKLLGAAGMASGDTAYLAPGTYREVVSVAMTSATVTTSVIGDPANAQGFKTSGGVLVSPGDVVWTGYTTNDSTAPSGTVLLNLAGRDFLSFQNITLIGSDSSPSCVTAATTTSINITFQNCTFMPSIDRNTITVTNAAGVILNWTIDTCVIVVAANATGITLTLATTSGGAADYDANVQIKNCLFLGGDASIVCNIIASGTLTFKGGGVDMLNCTMLGGTIGFRAQTATHLSTSVPSTCYNSIFMLQSAASMSAGTSGQILEDYNFIFTSTPRTNVTAGANSIATTARAPTLDIGQSWMHGFTAKPFFTPMAGSTLLGFGNQAGGPTVDALNRPRPAGGASILSGIGYLERHDTAVQETSVVQAGASGIKIIGPGDHDFQIPVDASSTTISIYARYDSTHAATNKPQAILMANGAIGVTAQTLTMSAAADTWEQLTFTAQTPSAKGIVIIRLVSRAAAGGGIAYFDTAAVV